MTSLLTKLSRLRMPSVMKMTSLGLILSITGVQAADLADQIDMRQKSFKKMGGAMKAINEELKSGSPDSDKIKMSAQTLADKATELPLWFPIGSGEESGLKTDALPAIWDDSEKFAAAGKQLLLAAQKLQTLSSGSDVAALRNQLKAVKDSCSNCHKNFRAD